MRKRVFKWMLMAAVVLGLGLNVTACKDDDDEKNSENEELKAQDPYAKNGDWISTENSAEYGYILKIDAQNGIRFVKEKKDMKHVVYPFILFG